jgi:hypothetical protein
MTKRIFALSAIAMVAVAGFLAVSAPDANADQAPKPTASTKDWRKFVLGNPKPPVRPK